MSTKPKTSAPDMSPPAEPAIDGFRSRHLTLARQKITTGRGSVTVTVD